MKIEGTRALSPAEVSIEVDPYATSPACEPREIGQKPIQCGACDSSFRSYAAHALHFSEQHEGWTGDFIARDLREPPEKICARDGCNQRLSGARQARRGVYCSDRCRTNARRGDRPCVVCGEIITQRNMCRPCRWRLTKYGAPWIVHNGGGHYVHMTTGSPLNNEDMDALREHWAKIGKGLLDAAKKKS